MRSIREELSRQKSTTSEKTGGDDKPNQGQVLIEEEEFNVGGVSKGVCLIFISFSKF